MSERKDRPSGFPWPPVLYLSAIALSVLLGYTVPLPWFVPPMSDLLFAIGWLMIAAVVAIDLSAMRTLRRAKTTIWPTRGSDHLVTGGPYAFTRNPIYLANTMLMFGLGLVSGFVWFFVLGLAAAFATQKLAIEPEEKHLELRFGRKYRDYRKKVRRWL
ncbi:isoprenylcysteine carboxylmethyltransferase family protein [Aquibium sp. A9E412]|uniref:methyltransferase family protein n=1 Tax=Aquibium sp. A9E412 TaxID=2976767 RepID=UPI0025AF9F0A|nr:isoprenylcysteine carboxylmethyltransferase family protein [Aquibium sp. A9E412]MDN2567519.1 isoprenylcysteine carboxylmethyltransferase family protein [Aquibium sp. A9E412]